MFKSKKWLFLLIPLTLSIWGYIGYEIYKGLNPELPTIEPVDESRFRESETKKASLVLLEQPESDPFLGTKYRKVPLVENKKAVIAKSKKVEWPTIKYMGYIKNKDKGKKVVAVMINGKIKTFESRQIIDSIQLINANANSISLRYKKEVRRFEK